MLFAGLHRQKASKFYFIAGIAKLYFDWTSFFMISRNEIIKNDVQSKLSSTAEGSGRLFTKSPQKKYFLAATAAKNLVRQLPDY